MQIVGYINTNRLINSSVSQSMQLRDRPVLTRKLWTFRLSVHRTPCWRRSVNFLKKPQKQVGRFLLLIKILGARGCGDILAAITDEILTGGTNSKTAYVTTSRSCKICHQGLDEHSAAGFHFVTILSSYYLGTTLTNENSIAEEIKSRLRSGNACYHSVQNFLSSRLLSKNFNIKIYIYIYIYIEL